MRAILGGALALGAVLLGSVAQADVPYPGSTGQANPYAYESYLRATPPIDCNATVTHAPNDLDCNDWHMTSKVDTDTTFNKTAQELGGVMGPSIDKAWDVSTGRPDVHIAVLDSGIIWNDGGAMHDLRRKVALNWAELPVPQADSAGHSPCDAVTLPARTQKLATPGFPTCYDVDHNGVFNVDDYATDPRVNPPNHAYFCAGCAGGGAGLLTPEDLIEVFSCYDASDAVEPVGHFVNITATGPRQCDNGAQNVDNDANGFAHDIAGWNFMERTNDPYDEPHYSHGTGEARDSNAEANNGGDIGTCPSCMVLPLKVGDSFIADVNDFAQAVLYATDNGVNIVQEALGTLNNSALNQAAIDYAYNHGVTVMSSAADEEAGHHNQPASSENHTVVANSLRLDDLHDQTQSIPAPFQSLVPATGKTYLSLNGCTNYGGHTVISVPSASCSSEAVGKSSGMAGLIYSTARNLVKLGLMQQYAAPSAGFPNGVDISPNEVKQVLAMTADDVDFEDATPPRPRGDSPADATSACAPVSTDPTGTPDNYAAGNAGERFHSIGGFDQYYGYGRVNASCAVRAVLAGRIPPEVDITSPRWWGNLDSSSASAAYPVVGRIAAVRAASYNYRVQIAYGVQPHQSDWTTVYTSGTLTSPKSGTLYTLSGAQIAAVMPAVPGVTPACGTHSVDANGDQTDWLSPPYTLVAGSCQNSWDEYTFTVRIQATDNHGLAGEDRRSLQSQHDAGDVATGNGAPVSGFPKQLADQFGYSSDGASSPLMADLLGDNQNELVFGTSSGLVHALRADGSELPGWPVHVSSLCASQPPDAGTPCLQRAREPAFSNPTIAAVMQHSYSAILASVAVGDLDRTGRLEVVAVDTSGYVYVFEPSSAYCAGLGQAAPCVRPGFPAHDNFAFSRQGVPPFFNRDHDNRVQFGFVGSPALADLDNTGHLEIVAGSLDRHLYVFQPDGSVRPGFPVVLAAPEWVTSIAGGTDRVTLRPGAFYGTKIISSPAVGDLLGDGHKEIVVGRNEEYPAALDGGLNQSADSNSPALEAVQQSGLISSGNGRVYAVYSDGTNHAAQPCNVAGHGVPTNAYVCGWPVKVVKFDAELLPYVGSGVDTPPALAPSSAVTCPTGENSSPGERVAAFTSDGPAYIFGSDGKSCYGQGPDAGGTMRDRVLSVSTQSGNTTDTPYLEAVGDAAFGDLTGSGDTVMVAPTAGITRALDVILTDHQLNAQDGITAWGLTGVAPGAAPQAHAGFPHFMNDLQFFAGPAIADLNGAGPQEIVEGSATSDLRAVTPAGAELPGWSKNTAGWTVDTPAVGTIGADQHQKVATLTREGTVFVWQTTATACSGASWPRYKHDIWNSGDYAARAGRPSTITDLIAQGDSGTTTLSFTAPHGYLFCGNVNGYEVRYSAAGPIDDSNWSQATRVSAGNLSGSPVAAGQPQVLTAASLPQGPLWFAVQGVNDATRGGGNLAAISNAASSGRWALQATPNPTGGTFNLLHSVACPTATMCIGVGSYKNSSGVSITLAERWNGTSWAIQPTPNVSGAQASFLRGVSCASTTLCTAVGWYRNAAGVLVSLAEGWNGSSWAIQATPNIPRNSGLHRVSCLLASATTTNCTAAGDFTNSAGVLVTLAETWNGTNWAIQATPNPSGAKASSFYDVACTSTTVCTAVGFYVNGSGVTVPLAERLSGGTWTAQSNKLAIPGGAQTTVLTGVACPSAALCTAVGNYANSSGVSLPLAERWNGSTWTIQTTVNPAGAKGAEAAGVACPSTTLCTAVGDYVNSSGVTVTLAEQWSGGTWVIQATPNPAGARASMLFAVACPSTALCTAVGNYVNSSGVGTTLAERYS